MHGLFVVKRPYLMFGTDLASRMLGGRNRPQTLGPRIKGLAAGSIVESPQHRSGSIGTLVPAAEEVPITDSW